MAFYVAACFSVIMVSGRRMSTNPVDLSMPDVDTQIENIKKRYAEKTAAYPVDPSMLDVETQVENIKQRYAPAPAAYPVELSMPDVETQVENIKKRYASAVTAYPVDPSMPDVEPQSGYIKKGWAQAIAESEAIVAKKGTNLKDVKWSSIGAKKETDLKANVKWSAFFDNVKDVAKKVPQPIVDKDETNHKENTVKWSSFYGDVAKDVVHKVQKPIRRSHGKEEACSNGQEACLNQACDDSGPFHVNAEFITVAIGRVLKRIKDNQRKQQALMSNLPGRKCHAHSGCVKVAKENLALLFKLKRFKNTGLRSDDAFLLKYERLPFSLSPSSAAQLEAQFKSGACGVESGCENWVCSAVE